MSTNHRLPAPAEQPGGLVGAAAKPEKYALIVITKHGTALGARLKAAMPEADLWVSAKFGLQAPDGSTAFAGSPTKIMADLFERYTGLVFFISLGAVVRMIAPHLKDKHVDPAVLVVDDRGQFAIPVLSGHLGGANALARRIGEALGAAPVITTASDVNNTIAVDLFGREFGWRIEGWENVTAVSAAVVNEEPVAVFQDAGEPDWWPADKPLPKNIQPAGSLQECERFAGILVVTDRAEVPDGIRRRAVLYRPRTLVVGVGCNRGTSETEIREAVHSVLGQFHLSPRSVRAWASIDAKRDEEGLLAAARAEGLEIRFFAKEALNEVTVPNPSEAPLKFVGAQGVAEPSALLGAGVRAKLIIPKQKIGNCTVAVARVLF